jgi:hypothetical protein
MKHTPGPWGYSNDLNRNSGTPGYSVGVAGQQIAEIDHTDTAMGRDAEANARLIAAAPEMLEALEECITSEGAMAFRSREYAERRIKAINEIVIKAIAKADGR